MKLEPTPSTADSCLARGVYAASTFASQRVDSGTVPVRTLKRPEGRVPGQGADASSGRRSRFGFTLIEIMVVVVLMSVIILGLMAMFSQTQRAFKAGMAQTDVLEGGRMATEMLARELEQIKPAYVSSNAVSRGVGQTNFFTQTWNDFPQTLPASTSDRTNLMGDLFFVTHENQTWIGIGYFIIPDSTTGGPSDPVPVGTLFRFETNMSAADFALNPGGLFAGFAGALNLDAVPTYSKILDGVVSFNFRTYDTNGYWINPFHPGQIWTHSDWSAHGYNHADYHFTSNAVPAFVEFEFGLLEQASLDHYKSIPIYTAQTNYFAQQAGRVHLFRQRVAVRNVDPSAY